MTPTSPSTTQPGAPAPTPEQIHAMKRLKVLAMMIKSSKPHQPGKNDQPEPERDSS